MFKKFKTLPVALLTLLLASCGAKSSGEVVHNVSTDISKDASLYVYSLLNTMDKNAENTISFEKGVYHFYPEKAGEKFCFVSNHNDRLMRIAFDVDSFNDLTIEGNGSTFIFHGMIIPFLVDNSEDITVKDLTIDFSEPFHSEGLVVANNPQNGTFDMQITEEYPYEIRNGNLTFIKPYYEHEIGQTIIYNPEKVAVSFAAERYTPITCKRRLGKDACPAKFEYPYKYNADDRYIRRRGWEYMAKATELEKGLVRIEGHKKQLLPVGHVLTMKGEQGDNRYAPGFKFNDTKNILVQNVTVNHACGMGFLFEHCENSTLKDCIVAPSNGRMVSTTADASHFVGCRGEVNLIGCEFSNQLDDASNIHGAYQEVVDIFENNTVGVRVGHFQQLGFSLAKVGDTIGVVRLSDAFDPYTTLTVKDIEYVNGRYGRVTFNETLPEGLQNGDLLENLSAYPTLLVEGCTFKGNRARGLLLSTPKKTIIRNNYFFTEMEALLIPVESSSWFESGSAQDLLIEGNTFHNSMYAGDKRGVIRLVTDDNNTHTAFRNIVVKNNTFEHYDSWIVEASNVDGFTFEGNTITKSDEFPSLYPEQPAFTFNHSANVNFAGNKFSGVATEMIRVSDDMKPINFK